MPTLFWTKKAGKFPINPLMIASIGNSHDKIRISIKLDTITSKLRLRTRYRIGSWSVASGMSKVREEVGEEEDRGSKYFLLVGGFG